VLVLASGIEELDRLVARSTRHAVAARALAERFARLSGSGHGDDAVVAAAVRRRAVVVTADRALQARLRARGIAVLAPRDRHRLELRPGDRPLRPNRTRSGAVRRRARGNG
jgi:rRNA-processing protein FCF1